MRKTHSRVGLLSVLLLAFGSLAWAQPTGFRVQRLAPYVPSPPMVVERMLALADVQGSDTVYDLGSGDGRIVITAAQKFGARAVGIEIDEELVKNTRQRLEGLGLREQVEIMHADILEVDFSPASVVTLYLLTSSNKMLKPKFEQSLQPGSRVVSHDFRIEGWKPLVTEKIRGEGRTHTIYLYEIGKH